MPPKSFNPFDIEHNEDEIGHPHTGRISQTASPVRSSGHQSFKRRHSFLGRFFRSSKARKIIAQRRSASTKHQKQARAVKQIVQQRENLSPAKKRKRSKRKILLKFAAGSVASFVFITIIIFGSLHVRLGYSPLSVKSLTPYLENSINNELRGVRVKIGDIVVKRASMAIIVRIQNLEFFNEKNISIATAPEAALRLSGTELLRGKFIPSSIDLIRPRLHLYYDEQTGFSMTGNKRKNRDNDNGEKSGLLLTNEALSDEYLTRLADESGRALQSQSDKIGKELFQLFDAVKLTRKESSALNTISFTEGQLLYHQGKALSLWKIPEFSMTLEHENSQSSLKGRISAELEPGVISQANFKVIQGNNNPRFEFNFDKINLSKTMSRIGYEGMLQLADMPLAASVVMVLSKDAKIKSANAIIKLSDGQLLVPGSNVSAINIKNTTLRMEYENKGREKLRFLPSVVRWDQNEAVLRGAFSPLAPATGWSTGHYYLTVDNITLGIKEGGLIPNLAGQWLSEGTYDILTHHIHVSNFVYQADETEVYLRGDIFKTNEIPDLRFDGQIRSLSLDLLKKLWNPKYGGEAREWVVENVRNGKIIESDFEIDMGRDAFKSYSETGLFPEDALSARIFLSNIAIRYLPKAPLLLSRRAQLKFTGNSMAVETPVAFSDLPSGRRVKIRNVIFSINDFGQKQLTGKLGFDVDTTSGSLVELMQTDGYQLVDRKLIKPENLAGTSTGRFQMDVPLSGEVTFDNMNLRGTLKLAKIASKKLVGNYDVTGGNLNLRVNGKSIASTGRVFINHVPADVHWEVIPDVPLHKQPAMRISAYLTPKHQKTLGLNLAPFLAGDLPVVMTVQNRRNARPRVHLTINLDKTHMKLENLLWEKPAGILGTLQFDLVRHDTRGPDLKNLVLRSRGIEIEGKLRLNAQNQLSQFNFSNVRLGDDSAFSAKGIVRKNDNVLELELEGEKFDVRPWLNKYVLSKDNRSGSWEAKVSSTKQQSEDKYYGVDIKARIGLVKGHFNTHLTGLYLAVKLRKGRLVSNILKGWFKNGTPLAANLLIGANNQRFIVTQTKDAGEALRFVGVYDKVQKGSASLKVSLDPNPGEETRDGILYMNDFALVGERIVSNVVGSLPDEKSGDTQRRKKRGKNKIQRTRLDFDKLKVPFTVRDGSFSLMESYINGPILGATLRGRVDLKNRRLDLAGTYVPLYGLNSTLGAVPILGDILVGRKGEGMFGITFGIRGPTKNPEVIVNPMSLITPGIFRQITEFTTRDDAEKLKQKKRFEAFEKN